MTKKRSQKMPTADYFTVSGYTVSTGRSFIAEARSPAYARKIAALLNMEAARRSIRKFQGHFAP